MSTTRRPLGTRVLALVGSGLLIWAWAGEAQERPTAQPGAAPTGTPPPPGVATAAVREPAVAIHTRRRPGVPARAAALLLSGQQGGPIGVSALAVPTALGASGVRLFFAVDVDGSSLLAGSEGATLPVEIAIYAVNPQGGVGGSATESFSLDVERAAEYLVGGGIKFLGALDLPPARYTLRVLVRNVSTGTFGIIEVPRALSSGDEPFAFLSPPLVPEPASAWLLAREAGQETPLNPFPFLGDATVLSTAPVLPGGTATRFWVIGRGLAPGTTSLTVRVLDIGGHELAKVPAAVVARRDSTVAGAVALNVEVALPALAPAQYTLEVSAPSMNPDILLWATTRCLISEKEGAGKSQVWVRFAAPGTAESGPRPPTTFVGRVGRVKASPAIKAAYRKALGALPTDPTLAEEAIAEIEAAALPTGKASEWETLVLSEAEVAQGIGGPQPAAVLALVLLHSDLQRNYTLRKAYLLEAHARRMVEELAVLYAGVDKSPQARTTAADALASLGGSMQQPGTLVTSERLFRRALELDPTNAAALMALAATMERIGQYQRALQQLQELVKAQPENAEARLRLAINVGRVASERTAHELLRGCIGPENPEWVRAVANQELARSLIQAGRFGEAQHLLREALAALPGEEGLTLQLAYVLDREHRPVDAQALTRDLATGGKTVDVSPRFRYGDWPSTDLERARRALRDATGNARQALASALGATGKEAAGGHP